MTSLDNANSWLIEFQIEDVLYGKISVWGEIHISYGSAICNAKIKSQIECNDENSCHVNGQRGLRQ